LAEVCAPDVVVILGVRGAQSLAPHDVVGSIDDTVAVVVAGKTWRGDFQRHRVCTVDDFPKQFARERGQQFVGNCSSDAPGGDDDFKRIAIVRPGFDGTFLNGAECKGELRIALLGEPRPPGNSDLGE